MHPALGLLIAYLAGSFPSAYLAGRLLKGIDLRTKGSGNLGASNVYRNLGATAAVVVLLVDILKGALPVFALPRVLGAGEAGSDAATWWALLYGVAAIVGHAKPVFLLWKGGGKGAATALGVFLVLMPVGMVTTVAVCFAVVAYTGYMSVGSIVAAVVFPLLAWIDGGASPVFWVGLGVGLFIVWAHRSNFRRLREGTESRLFGEKERGP